jgi:hypothetical protein
MDIVKSIRISIDNNLQLPSLLLIYSGIDISGWLGAKTNSLSVRDSFTNWVDQYMLPSSSITCSSIDLYSARCAILHTLTPDSRLSRSGEARRIAYAWGDTDKEDLEQAIAKVAETNLVVLHVEDLFDAFRSGWVKFVDAYEQDASVAPLYHERASKVFVPITKAPILDFIED